MSKQQNNDWLIWQDAVQRDVIDRAIRSLYAALDAAVAERSPVCNTSGRCCRFEEFGHRLYVTGLEIAWFLQALGSRESGVGHQGGSSGLPLQQLVTGREPQASSPIPNCLYQVDGLCSTHTIRPLGCRVFFCEAGTEAWQQDTTERFLDRLKQLHAEHGLPYVYMEWRTGLVEARRALG